MKQSILTVIDSAIDLACSEPGTLSCDNAVLVPVSYF